MAADRRREAQWQWRGGGPGGGAAAMAASGAEGEDEDDREQLGLCYNNVLQSRSPVSYCQYGVPQQTGNIHTSLIIGLSFFVLMHTFSSFGICQGMSWQHLNQPCVAGQV